MVFVMRRPLLSFISLLLTALPLTALAASAFTPPWPWEGTDLEPDPAVRWGVLENGLRYGIMPHSEPPGRASLRLLVEAGSLMESETERGIAHYLEHMGFNGSENFPPGELVKLFQELGMAFGPDTNAHTWWTETVYKFELPDVKEKTMRRALLGLRDYAAGLLFLPEEVDRERGIILSEKRDADTPGFRSAIDSYRSLMPYTKVSDRFAIGVEETIRLFDAEDFHAFYDRWYTTDRLAVLAVGDFEPDEVEAFIEEKFGSLPPNPDPLAEPEIGAIIPRGYAFSTYFDSELPNMEASIATVKPVKESGDSIARRANELALDAATAMLSRRLAILSREPDAPFTSAVAYAWEFFDYASITGVQAIAKAGQWAASLQVIENELRRSLEYGFQPGELAIFVANKRNDLETAVAQAASRKSRELSQKLSNALSFDDVPLSPAQARDLYTGLLDDLTPEMAWQAWKANFPEGERLVRLEGNEAVENAYGVLVAAYEQAAEQPVAPPAEETDRAFAYTDFGPAGEIVSTEPVEGLDATTVTFANGLVLHHKRTDFEQGKVRVALTFGGGRQTQPAAQPGLSGFAQFSYTQGGLEAHSVDDIQAIFAGQSVSADFAVDDDQFILSGTTTPGDLLAQMQLLAAYLRHPGFRPEAETRLRAQIPQIYQQLDHTVNGVTQAKVEAFLAGGDPRFGWPEEAAMLERNLAEVEAWLEAPRETAPRELTVVGDIALNDVLDAVKATFAALPATPLPEAQTDWEALEKLDLPAMGEPAVFTYTTQIPKGRVLVYWPTVDQRDIREARRLSVLASVMSERLRVEVREAIGEAYSPFAYHRSQDVYDGFGFVVAIVNTDPGQSEMIADLLVEIGQELADEGIPKEEFERVKRPLVTSLEEQQRNNPYWLNTVLGGSQREPYRLDWSRSLFTDYPAITREEVEALARKYLGSDRAIPVIIAPISEKTASAAGAVMEPNS